MRQVGVLAAAGIVALRTMVERLADDHANARRLAEGAAQVPGLDIDPDKFRTNIVFVNLEEGMGTVPEFVGRLAQEGLKVSYPGGNRFRMVTNRHVTGEDVDEAVANLAKVAREVRAAQVR